jgi:tRNA-specific 2-thiouridylase
MTPDQIERAIFPLGDTTKDQVRVEAAQRGITVAAKPDSHDICFIPDGDTAGWLAKHMPTKVGEVRDAESGQVVGTHEGAQAFTVGQRRGLALGNPTGDGQRRYVVDVDVKSNVVTIGPPSLLDVNVIDGVHVRWAGPVPLDGAAVGVQVRAHGQEYSGRVTLTQDGIRLTLDEHVRGLAAGQTAVMYDGTRVVGSATVDRTHRS